MTTFQVPDLQWTILYINPFGLWLIVYLNVLGSIYVLAAYFYYLTFNMIGIGHIWASRSWSLLNMIGRPYLSWQVKESLSSTSFKHVWKVIPQLAGQGVSSLHVFWTWLVGHTSANRSKTPYPQRLLNMIDRPYLSWLVKASLSSTSFKHDW